MSAVGDIMDDEARARRRARTADEDHRTRCGRCGYPKSAHKHLYSTAEKVCPTSTYMPTNALNPDEY